MATGIWNFISNLTYTNTIANDLLQARLANSANDATRFVVNTVFGLGGLLDPASRMGLERHHADFGQTLGIWGVPSGPFLMLPVLGPSNVRDLFGRVADEFLTPPAHLITIGPELPGSPEGTISIVGAGMGFGVSCLLRNCPSPVALATEAGHCGFAPNEELELAVWRLLARSFGRVSLERILSGPGIANLHRALAEIAGRPPSELSAEHIVQRAMQGEADGAATLTMFCSILGAAAGDIALMHGARGGVLLAGGIAPQIVRFLAESPFRNRFEHKGRLAPYMREIPTRLILNPDATLLGAARAARVHRLL